MKTISKIAGAAIAMTTGFTPRRGERVRVIYRERHGRRYAIQILPAA